MNLNNLEWLKMMTAVLILTRRKKTSKNNKNKKDIEVERMTDGTGRRVG